MYKIKQIPEDFIVKEIAKLNFESNGPYSYFKLFKKNRNTLDVVKELTKQLKIKEKQIGFAGTKDKHAVTFQNISVQFSKKEKVLATNIENVNLEFLGCGKTPISLGDLDGNEFEIIVRDTDSFKKIDFVENYFDEQRFSKHNAQIGKHIIKKEFKESLQLIDNYHSNQHLKQKPNDFIGALKLISKRLLRLYVHSYQSYLWNQTVANYLRKNNRVIKEIDYSLGEFIFTDRFVDLKIPLIGFMSDELESEEIKLIVKELMDEEKICYSDFIIRQIPDLSRDGELRVMHVMVKNLKVEEKGENKIKLKFFLSKGSYATMVIRKIIN
jgi:tRNA pseudouridine13 synthase